MKNIIIILNIILFNSCNSQDNLDYKINIDESLILKEKITEIEFSLNKVEKAPKYENLSPQFSTNKKNIYLLYSNINYSYKDSIIEGRYNPNLQNVTFVDKINGIEHDEMIRLKKNIIFLCDKNICFQEYVLCDPDNQIGFYIYRYVYQEWMLNYPEKIGYIALLNDEIIKSDCFKGNFIILDKLNGLFLITKKK